MEGADCGRAPTAINDSRNARRRELTTAWASAANGGGIETGFFIDLSIVKHRRSLVGRSAALSIVRQNRPLSSTDEIIDDISEKTVVMLAQMGWRCSLNVTERTSASSVRVLRRPDLQANNILMRRKYVMNLHAMSVGLAVAGIMIAATSGTAAVNPIGPFSGDYSENFEDIAPPGGLPGARRHLHGTGHR
jgi:hypothetical protein